MTETSYVKILSTISTNKENCTEKAPLAKRLPSYEVSKISGYDDALANQHPHDECYTKFAATWFVENEPKIIDDYMDNCQKFRTVAISA